MHRAFLMIFVVLILINTPLYAQEDTSFGRVMSISGKTVIAQFENITISVGDEVEIQRTREIVDPVSGKVRGGRSISVARGVIDDFGLGKASIRILQEVGEEKVEIGDMVVLTGKEKKIIRPEGPQYGAIQEISEDIIVTDLGLEDEISEGDIFLIQRTETVYDPQTKEITGTRESNVGRVMVDSVTNTSSVTHIIDLQPDKQPQITDSVVKESEYLRYLAALHTDSLKIVRLEAEVKTLKQEVRLLKSTLDSLGYEQSIHINNFEMLKNDIESVLSQIMSGDIESSKIYIENDEPISRDVSANLFELYKHALDECLNHRFQSAIKEFSSIIENFPDSKLTENCRYWIAQSYFNLKDYQRASEAFKTVINNTRFTHKDDDASIMLGITYFRMNKPDEALIQFRDFVRTYPESEFITKVNYWLQQLSS